MLYSALIEYREDDQVWHATTTTNARSAADAVSKMQRIAPFSRVSILPVEQEYQDCKAEYRGDRKANGAIFSMMLPEYNDGQYADRRYMYDNGDYVGASDLTLVEEELVAARIRFMLNAK